MKNIFVVIIFVGSGVLMSGCAQPIFEPKPEIPGVQQYYQMPGPYYTSPPPQLQYWDPRQDPLWQKEQDAKDNLQKRKINRRKEI